VRLTRLNPETQAPALVHPIRFSPMAVVLSSLVLHLLQKYCPSDRGGTKAHRKVATFSLLVLLWTTLAYAQSSISAADARNHIGEDATVCGQVASTHYAASSRGKPTFINLERPYPTQIFTVLVWGSDRPKFGSPEVTYSGKRICVSGRISSYRGVPEVIAQDPGQIRIQ
jgi:hypothetical protein